MPKPRVGVVGTDMEWGPMGELMTEKGGPMPLMGELRVLMGECSCPGEPREAPRPGPSEGCREGAAMEARPVGELRDEEFTWVEKSARQEPKGSRQEPTLTTAQPSHPPRPGPFTVKCLLPVHTSTCMVGRGPSPLPGHCGHWPQLLGSGSSKHKQEMQIAHAEMSPQGD